MKSIIFSMACLFVTSAISCEQNSAQFIGFVKNYNEIQRSETTKECFYEIHFTQFNAHINCPLDIDEVVAYKFQDYSCENKNGEFVSGILTSKGQFIVIE